MVDGWLDGWMVKSNNVIKSNYFFLVQLTHIFFSPHLLLLFSTEIRWILDLIIIHYDKYSTNRKHQFMQVNTQDVQYLTNLLSLQYRHVQYTSQTMLLTKSCVYMCHTCRGSEWARRRTCSLNPPRVVICLDFGYKWDKMLHFIPNWWQLPEVTLLNCKATQPQRTKNTTTITETPTVIQSCHFQHFWIFSIYGFAFIHHQIYGIDLFSSYLTRFDLFLLHLTLWSSVM